METEPVNTFMGLQQSVVNHDTAIPELEYKDKDGNLYSAYLNNLRAGSTNNDFEDDNFNFDMGGAVNFGEDHDLDSDHGSVDSLLLDNSNAVQYETEKHAESVLLIPFILVTKRKLRYK